MVYNRRNILGLQLRASTTLSRLSRAELFTRLQLVREVEPITSEAYRIAEEKIWRENLDDSPHGEAWHVSFHGSQFPGDDPMACGRQALYRMMNFPPAGPISRMLRQTATLGKAIESDIVAAWYGAGILISSPDPDKQSGFELPEAWLTSSVDSVILPKNWNKPLVVEIKQRKAEVIAEMKLGRGPFPEHVSQIKVQIAFVRLYQEEFGLWTDLDKITHGVLYYISRDNPLDTAEFRVDYDNNFFVAGVEKLKRWRAMFEEDHLPELDPGKRSSKFGHPNGWKWSYKPCQWCGFKKTCQLDFRESTTTLSESIGVRQAQNIRPDYDVEHSRLMVRARWQSRKNDDDSDSDTHNEEQPQTA